MLCNKDLWTHLRQDFPNLPSPMVCQQDLVEVVTSPQILKVLPLFGGEIVDTCQTGYLGEHIYHDQIVVPNCR